MGMRFETTFIFGAVYNIDEFFTKTVKERRFEGCRLNECPKQHLNYCGICGRRIFHRVDEIYTPNENFPKGLKEYFDFANEEVFNNLAYDTLTSEDEINFQYDNVRFTMLVSDNNYKHFCIGQIIEISQNDDLINLADMMLEFESDKEMEESIYSIQEKLGLPYKTPHLFFHGYWI